MNDSVYGQRIGDGRAVYFQKGKYDIDDTGAGDVSDVLQEAINGIAGELGYGILYVPEGKYLISKTIYIPKAVRIIGYGSHRPQFILKDNAAGFDRPCMNDRNLCKYAFWFVDTIVTDEDNVADANPGTFYSAMSNIDISLGNGNPYAVALRTHYAQHSFLSHMHIKVMSAMAGIYDVGNEMEHIEIEGGEYAIITTKCSPGWPFMMVDTYFHGQKKAAIKTHEAGLTIVRNRTCDVPRFIEVDDGFFEKVYMENCVLEDVSECALSLAMEYNACTQIVLKNVLLKNVGVLAQYRETNRVVEVGDGVYDYIHGTVTNDENECRKIVDDCVKVADTADVEELLESDLKKLPDVGEWVDVTTLGIVGDGHTDNSAVIDYAMDNNRVLFFPQGEYLFTERILLRPDTVLIGMHPFSTRLILMDNSESYTGFGSAKGFVETPLHGRNIINGIGIDTGGRNPRAAAVVWKSGAGSYANDVKLVGGHGNLEKGTGAFVMPYNESRTADADIKKQWDAQFSSFIVKNGGGTFKDIWSASPYAIAGFEVTCSHIPSKVYCMSLEHHQRNELIIKNSSGWKFYAIQTEEEFAEGEYALPMEIVDSSDITFNMAYYFRTIFVKTASDYCVKCYNSHNIVFNCMQNVTQMKYTFSDFALNVTNGRKIRTWQNARAEIGLTDGRQYEKILFDENKSPKYEAQIVRKYKGFRFADGGITDSRGNFYFLDSLDRRAYKIDGETLELSLILDSPVKINSIAVDTEDNIAFVGEYVIPEEATENGAAVTNELPPDSWGTSYGMWYNNRAVVFAFTLKDGEIVPLEKVSIGSVKPELVYYPGNRWRDGCDYREVVLYNPGKAYVLPDGKTIIPCHYDLIRANNLSKARPGEILYSVDELYKRVYGCVVRPDGLLENPVVVAEQGDYCAVNSRDGLWVSDCDIKKYDSDNNIAEIISVEERPTTFGLDSDNTNIKYVTTAKVVYVIKK